VPVLHSCLWPNIISFFTCRHPALLTHLSIDGHLGGFHLLPVVNKGAWTLVYKIWIPAVSSSGDVPRIGIVESYDNSVELFQAPNSCSNCIFVLPLAMHKGSSFSTALPTLFYFPFFNNAILKALIVWIYISEVTSDVEHLFICLLICWPFVYLL
jgi:hypothetical protein